MKKLILNLLSLTCLQAHSGEIIYADFWYAAKPSQLKLKVEPLQDSLAEECEEHSTTLHKFTELNAEEVAFYNSLPLKKQMGSRFTSVFRVKSLNAEQQNALIKFKSPLLLLNFNNYNIDLKKAEVKILSFDSDSLSALSSNAGAGLMAPEFKLSSVMSDEIFLTIDRRDIACDLIKHQIQLVVAAPVHYTLSEESAEKLKFYLEHLSRGVTYILSKNESEYVKAAKIGLFIADLQTSTQSSVSLVEHIFSKLFVNNSLSLSQRWSLQPDGSYRLLPVTTNVEASDNILVEL